MSLGTCEHYLHNAGFPTAFPGKEPHTKRSTCINWQPQRTVEEELVVAAVILHGLEGDAPEEEQTSDKLFTLLDRLNESKAALQRYRDRSK